MKPRRSDNVIDLFAGPGGWDVAAHRMGLDPLGIEWDDAACATREAAGLRTLQADVAQLDPLDFAPCDVLIASPPCQAWSMAGKGGGRRDIDLVMRATHDIAAGNDTRPELREECEDPRSMLVVEPLRWVLALKPRYIACEQVPPVLGYWNLIASLLEQHGYRCWAGVLEAERYGVPQTRERAILMASLDGQPHPPRATHQRYVKGEPQRHDFTLEGEVLPWVSMADALGWVGTLRTGDNTMKHSRDAKDMVPYERDVEAPAPTVDTKGTWKHGQEHVDPPMRWKGVNVPAPTVTAGGGSNGGVFGRGGVAALPTHERGRHDRAQR